MSDSQPPSPPIPVLFVVRELASGGIERDVAKLAKGLPRDRFAIRVATYKPAGPRYEELKEAGVPVFHIHLNSLRSLPALKAALEFARLLRRERIAILHAWDASAVFAVPIAKFMRVPVVLSAMLGSRELLDEKSRKQLAWTDGLVDGVTVNCEEMRRHLVEDYAVPRDHIELCYNGVDVSEFRPVPGEPRPDAVRDASLVIGTVCVLRVEKALHLLITAFAKVRDRATGARLLIVGSGPELGKLQMLSAELGLGESCVFVPAVRDVARYLRAIDIFVSCSYSEAFSNSILEAMASGCCVVGSRVGGTPELITDGDRGLLFESGSADELAEKLALLIDHPVQRAALAERARVFAATKLNIDVAVARMKDIYEQMLERKQQTHANARVMA